MKSPISYLGGKSRLSKQIVKMMPGHTAYVEPFCGAAWVFFEKPQSKVEVINDMNLDLVTFWRVIQHHLEEFLRHFKHCVISREIFDILNRTDPTTLTDIQRAVRFYYLQRISFGSKTVGRVMPAHRTRPPSINLTTLEEGIMEVHWRMQRVVIERMDALERIRRHDAATTLFYIDPPYYGQKRWKRCQSYKLMFFNAGIATVYVRHRKTKGRFQTLETSLFCAAAQLLTRDIPESV